MAQQLWLSQTTGDQTYTDSGGLTGWLAYKAVLSTYVSTSVGSSTTVITSSGAVPANPITFQQTSTTLVWISEQLSGVTVSTAWAFLNGWFKESAASVNCGGRGKVNHLSSNSTFIENVLESAPFGEMSATGFTNSAPALNVSTTLALSSGQRLAIIVQASSFGGNIGSGTVQFQFGNAAQDGAGGAGTGYCSWRLPVEVTWSTFSGGAPPSTQTFAPFANSLMAVGIGTAARSRSKVYLPPADPLWDYRMRRMAEDG